MADYKVWFTSLLIAACNVESPSTPSLDDPGAPYMESADFDRSPCDASTPLDSIPVEGVWHVHQSLVGYDGALPEAANAQPDAFSAMRIDGDGDAPRAVVMGRPTDDLRRTGTDWLTRVVWGRHAQWMYAFNACRVNGDGSVSGSYGACAVGSCWHGVFDAFRVERMHEPESAGLTLLSEFSGDPTNPWPVGDAITINVRHHEGIAYVARYDGLRIVDVSNPLAPVELGQAKVQEPNEREIYSDVKIVASDGRLYALLASNRNGVVVVDVTDPRRPSAVTRFPRESTNVNAIFVEGTRAYLANLSSRSLDVYDVKDPRRGSKLGTYRHPDAKGPDHYVHDLSVNAGRAYLSYWELGLVVVDTAADPANPVLVGRFDDYAPRTSHSNWTTSVAGRTVNVHGDEGFAAHVRIIDVDPDSAEFMTEIGSFETRPEVSVHNIMAVGETAFVAYFQDGLRILDLTVPTAPHQIAHYNTWPGPAPGYGLGVHEGAIGVDYDPASGRIYLADTHRGLLILTRQ